MKTIYITRNELFKNLNMIMCNNIEKVDTDFIDNNYELYSIECIECEGSGEVMTPMGSETCEECSGNGAHDLEAYQHYLISGNDWDIERLKEYGVRVGYSELLDLHVLPIYDYGTGWSAFSYSKEVEDDYELAHNETLTRTTVY